MDIELTQEELIAFHQAMGNAQYQWLEASTDNSLCLADRQLCADRVTHLKSAWRKVGPKIHLVQEVE